MDSGTGESASRFISSAFHTISSTTTAIGKTTLRGAKQTVKMTKSVTKSAANTVMHMDVTKLTSRVPRGNNLMRKMDVRKVFRAKHSQELGVVGEVDDSDSSDSEEEFTDEQVQERVDRKYFDPEFKGMDAELSQLAVSYADEDNEVGKELEQLDGVVRERNAQIRVVNSTLKKRILRNYDVFIKGVVQISDVNDDLLKMRSECAQGRQRLKQAKQSFVVDGLAIPVNKRRRQNLRSIKEIGVQMTELHDKYTCFLTMLDARKFTDAIAISREPLVHADLEFLRTINCMRDIVDQWESFTAKEPITMLNHIDNCIEDCITAKFHKDRYTSAMEASVMLDDQENACNKVVVSLYRAPEMALLRSITEVSEIRGEDLGLGQIMSGVAPEHLLLCFCQMSGRLADFLVTYSSVCRVHMECMKSAHGEHQSFHQMALSFVKTVGKKIGFNLHAKLVEALEGAQFGTLDLEKVLHCFHIVMTLVEATSALGCDKDSMAAARACVKRCLTSYVATTYQPQRAEHLVQFMELETWEADLFSSANFRCVAPISPENYKATVKGVKAYCNANPGTSGQENPFFTPAFMIPPDITDGIDIVPFENVPHREVVNATTAHISNSIFEYVCRAAVRFPPLAGEVLTWCEELVNLYLYIAAANFISVSRTTPLEEQADFSEKTREHLSHLRGSALRAAPFLNKRPAFDAEPLFPPAVFQNIDQIYSSKKDHFALIHRAVSIEGAYPLVHVLRKTLDSIAPLLSISAQREKKQSIDALELCVEELLHIGMHRLSSAIYPTDELAAQIGRTRFAEKEEMKPSLYINLLSKDIKELYDAFDLEFPSEYLRAVFWARMIFSIQMTMSRAYARQTRKLTDLVVSQMMVDAQAFQQRLREHIPKEYIIFPTYCKDLLKVYFDDKEGRTAWMKKNHDIYQRHDLIHWLSCGDKEMRLALDKQLDELEHSDSILVKPFLKLPREKRMPGPSDMESPR